MISKFKTFFVFFYEYLIQRSKERKLYKEFYKDFERFNLMASSEQKAKKEFIYPCLYDKTGTTNIEPIYFYQDAWAFERIVLNNPSKHIDIGSHHAFVTHLSKLVNLTMVDIRPFSLPMDSINFIEGSILNLPFPDNSIASLSSLCVIEHIGLGRYGDTIDPEGSDKAFKEIDRVICSGGDFYFSIPIEDKNKIYFNAHRAFNENYILQKILANYSPMDIKYIYGKKYLNTKEDGFGIGLYHVKKNK